jgi:hypothetical protein
MTVFLAIARKNWVSDDKLLSMSDNFQNGIINKQTWNMWVQLRLYCDDIVLCEHSEMKENVLT